MAPTARLRPGKQMIRIANIEWLDELQPRAGITKEWSRELAGFWMEGSRFPAARVYQLPEGRIVAPEAFHRKDALLECGETDMLCDLVDGTIDDAVIYAAGSNRGNGKKPMGPKDVQKALEMVFRFGQWWETSASIIARFIGCSEKTVQKTRRLVSDREGRPLPDRVIQDNGNTRSAHPQSMSLDDYNIRIETRARKNGGISTSFRGNLSFVGPDGSRRVQTIWGRTEEEARQKLGDLLDESNKNKEQYKTRKSITMAAIKSKLYACGFQNVRSPGSKNRYPGIFGMYGHGKSSVVVVPCDFRHLYALPHAVGAAERGVVSLDIAVGQ